ncbi:hypothetical protein GUJ93_ZPchr0006g42583 [Zizania palustris]|uniref:Uncharacterized protein n=1 Tax=Zizania palustris TaxID=103762 RepID=A0A8J5SEE7_ZIZPA|nr:hypothetical protein GUJ93_ZPchr0006g42583 [Zizania palustris]
MRSRTLPSRGPERSRTHTIKESCPKDSRSTMLKITMILGLQPWFSPSKTSMPMVLEDKIINKVSKGFLE